MKRSALCWIQTLILDFFQLFFVEDVIQSLASGRNAFCKVDDSSLEELTDVYFTKMKTFITIVF